MDETEPATPPGTGAVLIAQSEEGPALRSVRREGGSQSKIPAILFWALGAALVFRVLTAIIDRHHDAGAGAGLVRWQPLASVAAAGRAAGKPLLYDFTAEWCLPCHRLDSEGWGDARIAAIVNDGFRSARIVDRQREEGKNSPAISDLQSRYAINAFPTLVVTDVLGREIARMEGYAGPDRLVQFLEDAKKKAGK